MAQEEIKITVKHTAAEEFVVALLEASGVSRKNAKTVAQGLVQADLRGVESHGINRIPSYLARIRNGVLDPKAEPALTQVTPVVAQVTTRSPSLQTSLLCADDSDGASVRSMVTMASVSRPHT
jgi:LDH2 family malate/lactate/ureidoglycolate dehydrogenase